MPRSCGVGKGFIEVEDIHEMGKKDETEHGHRGTEGQESRGRSGAGSFKETPTLIKEQFVLVSGHDQVSILVYKTSPRSLLGRFLKNS
jgi:hypothetical protein